jgi:hypothetical protein
MKLHLFVAATALTASLTCSSLSAAPSAPAPSPKAPVASSATALAGEYAGKWRGHDDASGNLKLKLKQDGAAWTAEASFTVEDASITPKVKTVKVEGGKVELTFGWEFRGTTQETTLIGEAAADTLSGRYESKTSSESTSGTWTVKRS